MLIGFKIQIAIGIATLISYATLTAIGQAQEKKDDSGFEVPSRHVSVLLVTDPKCPIQLSGPTRVLGWSNGGLSLGYNLQNVSKVNIESFQIEETNWFGSSGYSIPASMNEKFFFVPLMTMFADAWLGKSKDDLIPFHEKKVSKNFLYPANKIWIAMIVKVKLSDGTVYDASNNFDELTKFLDKQVEEFHLGQIDMDEREKKLLTFVGNFMKSEK